MVYWDGQEDKLMFTGLSVWGGSLRHWQSACLAPTRYWPEVTPGCLPHLRPTRAQSLNQLTNRRAVFLNTQALGSTLFTEMSTIISCQSVQHCTIAGWYWYCNKYKYFPPSLPALLLWESCPLYCPLSSIPSLKLTHPLPLLNTQHQTSNNHNSSCHRLSYYKSG